MGYDTLSPLDFEFTLEADIQREFKRIEDAADAACLESLD